VRPIALKRLNPFRYVGNQPFLHTPQTRGKTRSARSTRPAHDTDCTRDRAQTLYESAEASKAVGSRLPWLVITVYRNSSGIKEWDTRRTRRAYTIALLGLLISPPAFNSTNQRCRRSNLVTVAWLPIWCNWTTQYCEQHGRPQGAAVLPAKQFASSCCCSPSLTLPSSLLFQGIVSRLRTLFESIMDLSAQVSISAAGQARRSWSMVSTTVVRIRRFRLPCIACCRHMLMMNL